MSITANLNEAFAGESQASQKYRAFARRAEQDGLPNVARLFRAAADAENVHAQGHFRTMDGVNATSDNLRAAIAGETYEFTNMYPPMLAEAQAEGHRAQLMFRFAMKAEAVHAEGFRLGLEPVPEFYGGDFLPHADDVIAMVREVAHPGLCVHLDTGCVMLGGGDIKAAIVDANGDLGHFHISEPKLAPLRPSVIDHPAAGATLRASGYSGWVAIEMLQPDQAFEDEALYATDFAVRNYFGSAAE